MKRLSASIPDKLYMQLERLAEDEGRSLSNLVSYLLEQAADDRYRVYPERLVSKRSHGVQEPN